MFCIGFQDFLGIYRILYDLSGLNKIVQEFPEFLTNTGF